MMNELKTLATKALKVCEDEQWTMEQYLENWEDDEEITNIYNEVVDTLTPSGMERDSSKIQIAHGDNVENDEEFLDFYDKLTELEPIKEIDSNISVYDVDGTLYATEYGEGGMYSVMFYSK